MTVPLGLLAVNCKMNIYTCIICPFFDYFLVVNKILLTARAVNNINLAVAVAVVAAVVNNRAQGRETYTARNEKQVVTRKFGIDRERSAVRSAYGYFLPYLHRVQPLCNAAAFLYGKFHKLGICGGRCD